MKKSKRGEYTRKRKKKFLHLKNTGMLSEYYRQKRKPTKKEIEEFKKDIPKAEVIESKKQINMNKLLFFLPADNKWSRIIRRGVMIFLLAGISGVGVDIVQNSGNSIPAVWLPLITALLAMCDKLLSEIRDSKKNKC